MAFTSPTEQRNLLALSFEPAVSGYFYYHYRWSRGIPVTVEEREAYLNIPALGSRRVWRKSVSGRATVPPRAYKPVKRKLLAAMPRKMAVLGLLLGAAGVVSGLGEKNIVLAVIYTVAGLTMLVFGISIVVARLMQSPSGSVG